MSKTSAKTFATTFKGGFTVYDDASLYPNGAGARYYNTTGAPFSNLWNGDIDDLAAFSRALSAEEISSLYTGSWTGSSEGEYIQDLNYTYDANGNITRITDVSDTNTYKFVDYTYDDLNRLVTASSTSAATGTNYFHQYTYDAIGNITSSTPAGAYTYGSSTYANPHAATQINGVTYAYDTNGNLTSDGTWAHTWDYKNRLTRSSSTLAVTYAYDSSNMRVKLVTPSSTTIIPFPTYSTEGGTAVKYISANGQLIASVRGTGTSTVAYYMHPDHLASADKTTDESAVVEYSDYMPFGAVRQTGGTFDDRKGSLGKDFDADTGLNQYEARYMKSSAGRFISQDPAFWQLPTDILLDPQQLNAYAYAKNNPLAYKDANGKRVEIIAKAIEDYAAGTHVFLLITPDNHNDFKGMPTSWTLGGYADDSGSTLIKKQDAQSDRAVADVGYSISPDNGYLKGRADVQSKSHTDTQFIKAIMYEYSLYQGDAAYDPFADEYGYNSNNFITSILIGAGVDGLPWGGNAPGIDPGYGYRIPNNYLKTTGKQAPAGPGAMSSYATGAYQGMLNQAAYNVIQAQINGIQAAINALKGSNNKE